MWYRHLYIISFLLSTLNASAKSRIIQHRIADMAEVSVYIPDQYDATKTYKSLYFNDGETIFDPLYGWNLNLKLDKLIASKTLEPFILVGVHSKGNRLSWYNPYEDEWIKNNWGNYTAQSKEYTQLISETIIPFIEKQYSVKTDAASRAIFGYSLGGLHSGWVGLTHSGVFGFSAGLSPSYWVADQAIMNQAAVTPLPSRFWFDLGTAEWQYYIPFYKKLQQAGLKAGTGCFYFEVKNGGHTAVDWIERIDYPLIAFAGINQDYTPKKMDLIFECIPSPSGSGKIYRRINAILTLGNGIKYTLSNTAEYTLLKGDIQVWDDGTIIAGVEKKAEVQVSYGDFKKTISLSIDNCENN